MTSLPNILLILAAISAGATAIAALIALRSAREARRTIFPIVREEESVRAQRARISIVVWLAVTALFLGGWLAALRLTTTGSPSQISDAGSAQPDETVVAVFTTETPLADNDVPSPTTTQSPATEAVAPTITPKPPNTTTSLPSATPTLEPPTFTPSPVPPTATPTHTSVPPTATPTETLTPAPPTPTPTSLADAARIPTPAPRTPAPPGARMGPIQFATDITDDIQAINPDTLFSRNTETIYAVYPYSGMEDGLDFTALWYRNGVELVREEREWDFGDKAYSYSFLMPPGVGLYKLELLVNDSVLATKLFEIR
jgi:hypothetical protein